MTNPNLGPRAPSTAEKFYVYVHSRVTTGEPFYVGKGAGDRASHPTNRSEHWKRVVAKDGGFYLSYVARDINEDVALLLECELIDTYRRVGVRLVNQTDGGDGISGYRWPHKKRGYKMSQEQRDGISARQRAKAAAGGFTKLTDEHKQKISASLMGNKFNLGKKASEETRALLSAQRKGKQFTLGHKLTEEHKAKVSAGLKAFNARRRAET